MLCASAFPYRLSKSRFIYDTLELLTDFPPFNDPSTSEQGNEFDLNLINICKSFLKCSKFRHNFLVSWTVLCWKFFPEIFSRFWRFSRRHRKNCQELLLSANSKLTGNLSLTFQRWISDDFSNCHSREVHFQL